MENELVLVLELMDGGNLKQKLSKGPFSEEEAFKALLGILKGVQYMHKMGYVHRDLKPPNIMFKKINSEELKQQQQKSAIKKAEICEDDTNVVDQNENSSNTTTPQKSETFVIKLIDFGLCADLKDHSPKSLLNDKSGTVGYLAPELITMKKGNFYDEKVDVFSCGMVFYEM